MVRHTYEGEWNSYSLNLAARAFHLDRVRLLWQMNFVVGYAYEHEDGTIEDFASDNGTHRGGSGLASSDAASFFFNTGTELIRQDFFELADELNEADVDADDADAVRAFLLGRHRDDANVDFDY